MAFDPEALRQLNQIRIFDYFKKKSMPEFVEPLVTELVNTFASCSELQRDQLLSAISPESSVFGWYARKLAGRAARERSRTDLWNGLFALLIRANKSDFRDIMAPLALLYNSAAALYLHSARLEEFPRPSCRGSVEAKHSRTICEFG